MKCLPPLFFTHYKMRHTKRTAPYFRDAINALAADSKTRFFDSLSARERAALELKISELGLLNRQIAQRFECNECVITEMFQRIDRKLKKAAAEPQQTSVVIPERQYTSSLFFATWLRTRGIEHVELQQNDKSTCFVYEMSESAFEQLRDQYHADEISRFAREYKGLYAELKAFWRTEK